MKRFIANIALMGGILLCLSWVLDITVSSMLQHNTDRKYISWGDFTNEQIEADLVIMGASRAWVQYDPKVLDSTLHITTYNMGIDGSPLNRQICKYNIYTYYQKKKPDYIIINIDYFALEWRDGYEREQFFPYMMKSYPRSEIRKVEPFSKLELYVPLYRYIMHQGLAYYFMRNEKESLYKGYAGQDKEWDPTAFNQTTSFHFSSDVRTLEMIEHFLEERKAEGAEIVFCYAPIYEGFTRKIDNQQAMNVTYQEIADRYEIPIIDYTYDAMCSDTTLFYNAMHLNKRGAEIFSAKLAHDLDSLGIIK